MGFSSITPSNIGFNQQIYSNSINELEKTIKDSVSQIDTNPKQNLAIQQLIENIAAQVRSLRKQTSSLLVDEKQRSNPIIGKELFDKGVGKLFEKLDSITSTINGLERDRTLKRKIEAVTEIATVIKELNPIFRSLHGTTATTYGGDGETTGHLKKFKQNN